MLLWYCWALLEIYYTAIIACFYAGVYVSGIGKITALGIDVLFCLFCVGGLCLCFCFPSCS